MIATDLGAWPPGRTRGDWASLGTSLFLVIGSVITAASAVAGNGNVILVVAPFAVVIGAWMMSVTPLRWTLVSLIFVSLALDATGEGKLDSPLAPLGALLAFNLNKSIPLGMLTFPGFAAILAFLAVVHIHRRISGSVVDGVERGQLPRPMLAALTASLVAVVLSVANGVARRGDVQMAKNQVQAFVLLLVMGYLIAVSLRGLRDYQMLARAVVAAACIKAAYALYVVYRLKLSSQFTGDLAFATTHGDSLLFVAAIIMVIAQFAERPVWRSGRWCLILLPLLIAGTQANNRRLAWVEVVVGLLIFAILSRRTRLKRRLVHGMLLALPLFAAYVAIGWNSTARVFAPINTFRSISGSEVDASTLYRDAENYNLLATLRLNPLIGTGFGHPFSESLQLADISFFKEFRYMPHNSILGLWAFTGAFGFTVLSLPLAVGVYFAGRSYHAARSPEERVAAFMSLATIASYAVHCWGDIGFSEHKGVFLVGPALALAGHMAVSTGIWQRPDRKRVTSPGRYVA